MALNLVGAGPIAQGLFGLVDSLFTSDEERAKARLKLLELEKSGELAQLKVNLKEAEHTSLFVAGWRPFIGWVCGFAFAWTFLFYPMLTFGVVALGVPISLHLIPTLDLSDMTPVLMGMLGLGAMRSWEKREGVARDGFVNGSGGVDRRARKE